MVFLIFQKQLNDAMFAHTELQSCIYIIHQNDKILSIGLFNFRFNVSKIIIKKKQNNF